MLSNLPQDVRLGSAGLVSKALNSAAAAATDAIVVSFQPDRDSEEVQQARTRALQAYLTHHGRHVLSLQLHNFTQTLEAPLPCPRLLSLHISGPPGVTKVPKLHLGPSNNCPGLLASCTTSLTSLKLKRFTLSHQPGDMDLYNVSRLVNLCELVVEGVPNSREWLPCGGLSTLVRLTSVDLSVIEMSDVHQDSRLSRLSVLRIWSVRECLALTLTLDAFMRLPASLQQLRLGHGIRLAPAALASASQLTQLELSGVSVETHELMSSGEWLLKALARLQKLDSLVLHGLYVDLPPPSNAYTALVASSSLQKLVVRFCGLPDCLWMQHAFPPARSLVGLKHFAALDGDFGEPVVGALGVVHVVRCLPNLQDLELLVAPSAVSAATALAALTGLTLIVEDSEVEEGDATAALAAVAGLTRLRRLGFSFLTQNATKPALLELTALRRLTHINISSPEWEASNQVRLR